MLVLIACTREKKQEQPQSAPFVMEENQLFCYTKSDADYMMGMLEPLACIANTGYFNSPSQENAPVAIEIYITPDTIIIGTEEDDFFIFSLMIGDNLSWMNSPNGGEEYEYELISGKSFNGRISFDEEEYNKLINILLQEKKNEFRLITADSTSISFVLNSEGFKKEYEEYIKKAEEKFKLTWEIGEFVDEFGDKTGEKYIYSRARGKATFSSYSSIPINITFQITKSYFAIIVYKTDYTTPYIYTSKVSLSIKDKNDKKYTMSGSSGNKSNAFVFYSSHKDLVKIMSIGGTLQLRLKGDSFTASVDIEDNKNFKEAYDILSKSK
jgi:hypothetical protein